MLGKHSGRHALRAKLADLGYTLSDAELSDAFKRFKEIADKKKAVTVLDLEALVSEEIREREDQFTLTSFVNQSGSGIIPTSQVEVLARGEVKKGRSFSSGSVESVFAAIDDAVGISGSLADYQVRAISSGKDSLAEVRVAVEVNGRSFNGQAVSFDVMEASAKAGTVRAVNNAAAAGDGLMGLTITEKILAAHAGRDEVSPGEHHRRADSTSCWPTTSPRPSPSRVQARSVWTRSGIRARIALVPDHFAPNKDIKSAEQAKIMREFAHEQDIAHYFEIGCVGIEHALLPEQGSWARRLIIGADSHTCTYGALGASRPASARPTPRRRMATGRGLVAGARTIKFDLTGELPP